MDSILLKVIVIAVLLAVLGFIIMGDRRIRKERELEDREKQEKPAAGKSE